MTTTSEDDPVEASFDGAASCNERINNPLLYAVSWKQTAAEYRALYHQGFNVARIQVELALVKRRAADKPLAVITDIDDTVIQTLAYWRDLIASGKDFFDNTLWGRWIPTNRVEATPGAKAFLEFCESNKVQVFYISCRDQGDKTHDYAIDNLRSLNFPFADAAHVTVLRETSDKQVRQDEIERSFQVVAYLGDNLNDFRRKYFIKSDVNARNVTMEEDRHLYGKKYILFPNPTDGHWLAAIFGQSEPEATDTNRLKMKMAAMISTNENPEVD